MLSLKVASGAEGSGTPAAGQDAAPAGGRSLPKRAGSEGRGAQESAGEYRGPPPLCGAGRGGGHTGHPLWAERGGGGGGGVVRGCVPPPPSPFPPAPSPPLKLRGELVPNCRSLMALVVVGRGVRARGGPGESPPLLWGCHLGEFRRLPPDKPPPALSPPRCER